MMTEAPTLLERRPFTTKVTIALTDLLDSWIRIGTCIEVLYF
jgi:hypothetical protein